MQKKRHLHPGDILQDPRLERVLGAILSGAPNFVAADVFEDLAKLRVLQVRSKGRVIESTSKSLPCIVGSSLGFTHLLHLQHSWIPCSPLALLPTLVFCVNQTRYTASGCMAGARRLR